MIYPGLQKTVPRKPVAGTPMQRFTTQLFEPFVSQKINPIDELSPLPTLQDPDSAYFALATPARLTNYRGGTPRLLSTPRPRLKPPKPATPSEVKEDKGPLADSVANLETIATGFRHSELNVSKILAEAIIFIGLVMLHWSVQLDSPHRILAILEVGLVMIFFALHPIYAAVAVGLISVTYACLKLTYMVSKQKDAVRPSAM